MRRLALAGGWVVVVVLTTALTWQIVSAADDRVSERPSSPLNVAAPQLEPGGESTTPQTLTTTTTSKPTTTTVPGATTVPTVPGATTTTTVPGATSTSTSAPTSTTTSVVVEWAVKTTSTAGGTVVVKYRPGEVVYQVASPAAGFRVEVDKAGPPEVRVEFESENLKVDFRARWNNGELDIEISESEDD